MLSNQLKEKILQGKTPLMKTEILTIRRLFYVEKQQFLLSKLLIRALIQPLQKTLLQKLELGQYLKKLIIHRGLSNLKIYKLRV